MNPKIRILNGPSVYSPSTLLIPNSLLNFFYRKKEKFGSVKALFHYVVKTKMRIQTELRMTHYEGKVCYQSSGKMLHRKDFFPNLEDWEKFRMYAHSQRVSMTHLFVLILVNWERLKETKVGVPIIPKKTQLIQSLTINEIFTYLETQHLIL